MERAPIPYQFVYAGIVNEEFAFLAENYSLQETNARVGIAFAVVPDHRDVHCKSIVQLAIGSGQAFVVCSITCRFVLDQESWDLRMGDEKLSLGKPLLTHFATFTVGSLRGYLHARLAPTPCRALLPAVNVMELLEDIPTTYSLSEDKWLEG